MEEAGPDLGLCYTLAYAFDDSGQDLGTIGSDADADFKGRYRHTATGLVKGNHVPALTMMLRKEVYDSLGLWSKECPSSPDFELVLRTSLFYKFAFIDEKLAGYRVHAGSTYREHRLSGRHVDSFYRLHADFLARLDLPESLTEFKDQINAHVHLRLAETSMEIANTKQARHHYKQALASGLLFSDERSFRQYRLSRLPSSMLGLGRAAKRYLRASKLL